MVLNSGYRSDWLTNQVNNQSLIKSNDVIQLTLTLKMTTAQVVETSVTVNNNSPIQDYVHPDDHTQPTYKMTPWFKHFTVLHVRDWSKSIGGGGWGGGPEHLEMWLIKNT